ncbi:MAG: hypothetical protein FJY21_10890 [Bacteroidetes bacterium]|nr:hypothetical protein [Bacteroidota bacterium]
MADAVDPVFDEETDPWSPKNRPNKQKSRIAYLTRLIFRSSSEILYKVADKPLKNIFTLPAKGCYDIQMLMKYKLIGDDTRIFWAEKKPDDFDIIQKRLDFLRIRSRCIGFNSPVEKIKACDLPDDFDFVNLDYCNFVRKRSFKWIFKVLGPRIKGGLLALTYLLNARNGRKRGERILDYIKNTWPETFSQFINYLQESRHSSLSLTSDYEMYIGQIWFILFSIFSKLNPGILPVVKSNVYNDKSPMGMILADLREIEDSRSLFYSIEFPEPELLIRGMPNRSKLEELLDELIRKDKLEKEVRQLRNDVFITTKNEFNKR